MKAIEQEPCHQIERPPELPFQFPQTPTGFQLSQSHFTTLGLTFVNMSSQHIGGRRQVVGKDSLTDLIMFFVGFHHAFRIGQPQAPNNPDMVIHTLQVLHQHRIAAEAGEPDMKSLFGILETFRSFGTVHQLPQAVLIPGRVPAGL